MYPLGNGIGRLPLAHSIQDCLPLLGVVVREGPYHGMALALLCPQPFDLGSQVVFGSPLLILVGALLAARPAPPAWHLSIALAE